MDIQKLIEHIQNFDGVTTVEKLDVFCDEDNNSVTVVIDFIGGGVSDISDYEFINI